MFQRINKTATLKINLASNYLSSIVNIVLSIAFVPIYLKNIGAEGYGLIGVFASLQGILSVLDVGLGGALSREIARHSEGIKVHVDKIGDISKTLGTIYWALAVLMGIIAIILSPLLANYWVKPITLTHEEVVRVFILLSISLVFYFPIGFYSGGIIGLQKHVLLNVLKISFAILKNVGSVLALIISTEKIQAFFVWNLIINVMQAMIFKMVFWYSLPKRSRKSKFDKGEIKSVWKYAMGLTGISITALMLGQVDRVILSKTLPLDQFGYYSLAGSITVLIYQIIQPINQVFFPKFASLNDQEDRAKLKKAFSQAYQIVALLIIPASLVLVFYSHELLFFFTKDLKVANQATLVLSVLALGTGLNALLNIPFQLTIAFGWTKFALFQNIIFILLLTPLTIWLTLDYGAIGGAISLLVLNSIMVLIMPIIIHKRILKTEKTKWYMFGLTLPLVLTSCILFCIKQLVALNVEDRVFNFFVIGFIGLICVIANSVLLPEIRSKYKSLKYFN